MTITEDNRDVAIHSPLGEGVLLLRSMEGAEQLGRLYSYELQLLSTKANIQAKDILGQKVTIRLRTKENTKRYFNGHVNRFDRVDAEGEFTKYRVTVVPSLWFLTRNSDCRIFQNKTVPEIIENVLQQHGIDHYERRLFDDYRKLEYCVQYRETDFNFISRLMEQEGIYYFFIHENGSSLLVLADSPGAHESYPNYEEIRYLPAGGGSRQRETICDWMMSNKFLTTSFTHKGYDFEHPKKNLLSMAEIHREHAFAGLECYDYPGDYLTNDEGQRYALVRAEEIQCEYETFHGHADARGIAVGHNFHLNDSYLEDRNRMYLTTRVKHTITSDLYGSRADAEIVHTYTCDFSAIPANTHYRVGRTTPKPIVHGPQTAVVIGPDGEEIHTDEHGRVRVRFHWDREHYDNDASSCWIRVTHASAGKKWGTFSLPRVGQEVVVEFLEGNPDLPIITGSIYNGDNPPPYPLPGNKTISTIKSNSTKGGNGFNEIRFEDKKGEEQIFIHGEKNQDIRIRNDRHESIGHDRHLIVKNNKNEHVENNRSEVVDACHMEKIGQDRHVKVIGKEAIQIGKSKSLTVKGNVIESFRSNHSEQVTKDYALKADNICIEADTNITLMVGQSYIAIEANGIKIGSVGNIVLETAGNIEQKANQDITIESSMRTAVKGTCGLKLESPAPAELKSAAVLSIKGSLVKIN